MFKFMLNIVFVFCFMFCWK
ncbi:hypothetical protein KUCAC02_035352 [Chaenocephalus aceratus]|nr:hypothetical protein KUCAC02_035352 [Chaenocephalus aceratus]